MTFIEVIATNKTTNNRDVIRIHKDLIMFIDKDRVYLKGMETLRYGQNEYTSFRLNGVPDWEKI